MKSEAQFKVAFKDSVRKQKGYSISLAAPVFPGIPDLYVIMPNYMPVLIEAKWLGKVLNNTFSRKIKYSPMQLNYAKHLNSVQPGAMLGLIGVIYRNEICCVLDTIDPSGNNNLTNEKLIYSANYVTRQEKAFDVEQLFRRSSIPMLMETKKEISIDEYFKRTVGITDVIRGSADPSGLDLAKPVDQVAIPGQTPERSTD